MRLLPALLLIPGVLSAQAAQLTRWESEAREIFRELIEINTTQSQGDMTRAAEAMASRLRAGGIPASDITVVESGAAKKGNLVARYRGRDASLPPIVLLAHIDVVEANPEDWTLPPFEFIERDGTFYGRGVADDKDEAAIAVTLLLRWKAEQYVPDRDVIIALTTDEEGGPQNGVDWLLQNRPDLVRAGYVLNEGGGGRVRRDGSRLALDVQASEKKYLNLRLEVTNPGGHSSRPVPDNAITHLAAALVKVGAFHFPVRLNEVTRAFFSRSAAIEPGETAGAMRRIVANERDSAAAALLSRNPQYNSLMRTTCVATMLDGGHAPNALPQRARANVNCRLLPDEDPEAVRATIAREIGNDQVSVTMLNQARNSPPSPLTPDLLQHIERIAGEMFPGVPVVPTMSTGATDGLYFRNAGIPVYGVSGLFYPNANAHGMNEHIPVRAFYDGLEFMYRLMRSLTGAGVT